MALARRAALAACLVLLAAPAAALAAESFTTELSGANSVPALDVEGSGDATVMISDDAQSVSWDVSYSGLTGDPTAGHIHIGAADANGPVMIPFATLTATGTTGTFNAADYEGGEGLPADWNGVLAAIRDGNSYVNIHTEANPGGEIRGQLRAAGGTPPTDTEAFAARDSVMTPALLLALLALGLIVGLRRFRFRD